MCLKTIGRTRTKHRKKPEIAKHSFHKNVIQANADMQAILEAMMKIIIEQQIVIKKDELSDWQ